MKLTPAELEQILEAKPVLTNEGEIKAAFELLGFKLKEYYKSTFSQNQSYEVHYRRTYLFKVQVDDGRCIDISNEYINFSDGCHGVSMGGIDTVTNVIQTVILFALKLNSGYDGSAFYNEDESEYTEDEYRELIETLNDKVFKTAA